MGDKKLSHSLPRTFQKTLTCTVELYPLNDLYDRLKKFLNAHSGFNRDSLQDYLNLFAFVRNPPYEMLEKVEKVVNLVFQNPKFLRYRDQFGLNQRVEI